MQNKLVLIAFGLKRILYRCLQNLMSRIRLMEFAGIGQRCYFEQPTSLIGAKYITLGNNVEIRKFCKIEVYDYHLGNFYTPHIDIGNNVSINQGCQLSCINCIEIADNVLVASNVYISDHTHGKLNYSDISVPPSQRKLQSKGPVKIKENAWLGKNVVILPGITIGKHAIIGANSVVTSDIPDYCIAAGTPAKVIRQIERI